MLQIIIIIFISEIIKNAVALWWTIGILKPVFHSIISLSRARETKLQDNHDFISFAAAILPHPYSRFAYIITNLKI
jgi:hypothetical protein